MPGGVCGEDVRLMKNPLLFLLYGLFVMLAIGVVSSISIPLFLSVSSQMEDKTPGATQPVKPVATQKAGASTVQLPRRTLLEIAHAPYFQVKATGVDLSEINLYVKSNPGNSPFELVVNPGILFYPASKSTQMMVSIVPQTFKIAPNQEYNLRIKVACANMTKNTPNNSDHFSISGGNTSHDLNMLLANTAFHQANFRLQQFAVWVITDNPEPLEFMGIGQTMQGSKPSPSELEMVRQLLVKAGINPNNYNAFKKK